MNNYLTYMGLCIIVSSLLVLPLSIKIVTGEVFLINSKIMILVPIPMYLFFLIIVPSLLYFEQGFSFSSFAFLIFLVPFLSRFFLMKKLYDNFSVFNTTEDFLYDCIIKVLDKHKLEYEEKRSQIILKGINASIRINFQNVLNTATLSFNEPQNIPNLKNLINDIKALLQKKVFSGFSFGRIFLLAFTLFSLGIGIIMLLKF